MSINDSHLFIREVKRHPENFYIVHYSGAWKIQINERFVRLAKLLQGNIPRSRE
jgi:hypothetical protein